MDLDQGLGAAVARAVSGAGDLQELARPLLELLEHMTGLESTYLTVVDWHDYKQQILYSHNAGKMQISEGLLVDWSDTLCRRALRDGLTSTADVPGVWGRDHAADSLGILSYASVPVITADRAVYGTLCAASTSRRELRDEDTDVMELFARLMADQVSRDRALTEERARATRAEERTRRRVLFLAAAEHKVKTPLTIILGNAQLLTERWDHFPDEKRREMVERVWTRSGDLLECIEAMLQEANVDMRADAVESHALLLAPELERVAADFTPVSDAHRIEVDCDPRLICLADAASLSQVLGHLVDNAMKYSSGDLIVLRARSDDRTVVVEVADNGAGMPDGDMFLPFQRGSASGSPGGTGLGLYVVRTLVEGMGGTIEAFNAPEGGAVFRITLGAG